MSVITYEIPSGRIVHDTRVDFSYRSVQKTIHIVQYDKQLPIIAVSLYVSGKKYTLPANMDVNVKFGKRDKTFVYKPVLGCNEARNVVYFEVDEQMSFYDGQANPIIELSNAEGGKAGSSAIALTIERNPIQDSDIESVNEYSSLVQAIADASNKEPAFAKNTAFNKNFGSEENTVTQGNDARLSDARIPLPHNHDDRYYTESEIDTFFIQRGEFEPEVKKGLWIDESVEGVGVDDVIIVKGTDLQVIGNVSGQIPILQDLIVKGAEISLIEGSSGQIQISGGEITIVNAEGVEEILIDETLTVSSVDMVSGTKYITIKNVIPII